MLDDRDIRAAILNATGGIPFLLTGLVESLDECAIRVTPERIEKLPQTLDIDKFQPGGNLNQVIIEIGEMAPDGANDKGDLDTIFDLLSENGFGGHQDTTPDLKVLGLIQSFDFREGRLHLSALGRLVSAHLQKIRKEYGKVIEGITPGLTGPDRTTFLQVEREGDNCRS